jgi:hypothetical protein
MKIANLFNRFICRVIDHKLFMLDEYNVDIQLNEYNGQEYVYCVRCKSYLPLYNLD